MEHKTYFLTVYAFPGDAMPFRNRVAVWADNDAEAQEAAAELAREYAVSIGGTVSEFKHEITGFEVKTTIHWKK